MIPGEQGGSRGLMIVPPLQQPAGTSEKLQVAILNLNWFGELSQGRTTEPTNHRTNEPPNHRLINACKLIARILELETPIL